MTFYKNRVYQATPQKHLGLIPGNRLSFKEHLTLVFSKINKVIGLLHKLQCVVLRVAPLAIYKTLSDLILIMVKSYTNKLIIHSFIRKYNLSNITHASRSQMQ